MKKLLLTCFLFLLPLTVFANIEDEIQKIADQYDSSNTPEYGSERDYSYIEYDKYRSDFEYNYGKYLSLKFIAENSHEDISDSEIKKHSDAAIDSMNQMLKINKSGAINHIENVIGGSSTFYINEYFGFPEGGYGGFSIDRGYSFEKLYSKEMSISLSNVDQIENVEGVYFGYSINEYPDGDSYYYSINTEDLPYKDKLKTIYFSIEESGEVEFIEIEGDSFTLDVSELVEEYEGKNIQVQYNMYIKYNESYYTPIVYAGTYEFELGKVSKIEAVKDMFGYDSYYYGDNFEGNILKREWANKKDGLSIDEFLQLLNDERKKNDGEIEILQQKIEGIIKKIDSDKVLEESRVTLETSYEELYELERLQEILEEFSRFYESLQEPIDLTPKYHEISEVSGVMTYNGGMLVEDYPEYRTYAQKIKDLLDDMEEKIGTKEFENREILMLEKLSQKYNAVFSTLENNELTIEDKEENEKLLRLMDVIGVMIDENSWNKTLVENEVHEIIGELLDGISED